MGTEGPSTWETTNQTRLGLWGNIVVALGSNAVVLCLNVLTGAVLARSLGPEGRGAYAVILNLPQTLGWLGTLGCAGALAYFVSRHKRAAGGLVGGWLTILIPIAGLSLLAAEAVLPTLFAAQDPTVVSAARWFLLLILLAPLPEITYGILTARGDFAAFNALRISQALLMAVALVVAATSGVLSLGTALLVAGVVAAIASVTGAVRALRLAGVVRMRPSRALRTLPYGLRAHANNIGSLLNIRLDLLILPMLIGAEPIGLYSVAASVAFIIPGIAGGLAYVLFPELSRRRRAGSGLVSQSAWVVLIGAVLVAAPLAFWADIALGLVYGAQFTSSAPLLRILLPGTVLYAVAPILWTALSALGLPGRAALAQLVGVAVTVIGLYSFVGRGGIVAAAWVSTAAYSAVLVAALLLYLHASRSSRRPPHRSSTSRQG